MGLFAEKLEFCPDCGKDLKQHEYDLQFCADCETNMGFKEDKPDEGEDYLRQKMEREAGVREPLRFECVVKWTVICSRCDVSYELERQVAAGSEPIYPTLPDDWRLLDGQPVCPRHKISVKTPRRK